MRDLIARMICSALNNLATAQPDVSRFIPQETAEREPNLSFHFANELWKYLFWLDCDFDVTKSFHEDKRPDIIFHKRGISSLNFLVVEVKRASNRIGFEGDVQKIRDHWFGGNLQYRFGASLVITDDASDYTLRLLERDSTEPIMVVTKIGFNSSIRISEIFLNGRTMLKTKAADIIQVERSNLDTTSLVRDLNSSICAVFNRKWNIDDIVVGVTAKDWLTKNEILPSTWGLSTEHVEFVRRTGIRLTMMCSPASELTLRPNPLRDVGEVNLIIFDADTLGHEKLSKAERIAMFLHELGHVFHALRPSRMSAPHDYAAAMNGQSESENAADDFAAQLGYGKQIVSSLEKLSVVFPKTFGTPGVKARVERMKAKTVSG